MGGTHIRPLMVNQTDGTRFAQRRSESVRARVELEVRLYRHVPYQAAIAQKGNNNQRA